MKTSELTKIFVRVNNFDLNLTHLDLEGCIENDYSPQELLKDAKEQIVGMIFEIELEEEDAHDLNTTMEDFDDSEVYFSYKHSVYCVIEEKLSALISKEIVWGVANVDWEEVEGGRK